MLCFDAREIVESVSDKYNGGLTYSLRMLNKIEAYASINQLHYSYLVSEKGADYDFHFVKYGNKIVVNDDVDLVSLLKANGISSFFSPMGYGLKNLNFDSIRALINVHGLRDIELKNNLDSLSYAKSKLEWTKFLIKYLFRNFFWARNKKNLWSVFNCKGDVEYICPSNHTKFSIVSQFNVEPARIKVVHSPLANVLPIYKASQPNNFGFDCYLLVSGGRWIKNTLWAMLALDDLITAGKVKRRVMVLGVSEPVKSKWRKKIKNMNHFDIFDYVDDDYLEAAYSSCFSLIYSTLNEGFGYPPLEAIRHGKPVLVSAVNSLPEICSSHALYYGSNNLVDFRSRILQLEAGESGFVKSDQKEYFRTMLIKQEDQYKSLFDQLFSGKDT